MQYSTLAERKERRKKINIDFLKLNLEVFSGFFLLAFEKSSVIYLFDIHSSGW